MGEVMQVRDEEREARLQGHLGTASEMLVDVAEGMRDVRGLGADDQQRRVKVADARTLIGLVREDLGAADSLLCAEAS